MDKKESFYWDLVKGIAIFLMLWGHCIQYCSQETYDVFTDCVYKTIYTFHMPVFMLVSGYLFYYSFRKRELSDLLAHRIQGMLHPIIMATILNNFLILILIYVISDRVNFLFGSLFWGIENDLWFLWAVLYCSLVTSVCGKLTDRHGLQLLLMILGAFAILLVPQWNMTLFMYPYFVAGYFCGVYREKARKLYRFLRYAVWLLFPLMVEYYGSRHYIYITPMFSEELGLRPSLEIAAIRWAIGFVGSIWMLSIVDILQYLGKRIALVQSCLKPVSHLGRNSLQIYCLSTSLLSGYLPHLYRKFTEVIGGDPFSGNIAVYDFVFTPVLAVAWSIFLYYVIVLMKKCKVHKLIFGR